MITEYRLKQIEFISSFIKLAVVVAFIIFQMSCNDCQIASLSLLAISIFFLIVIQASQKTQLFTAEETTQSNINKIIDLIKVTFPSILPFIIVVMLLYIFINYNDNIIDGNVPPEFIKMSRITIVITLLQVIIAFLYLGEQFTKLYKEISSSKEDKDSEESKMNSYFKMSKDLVMKNLSSLTVLLFIANIVFTGFTYVIISKFLTEGLTESLI